jgi:hypothetical protein
LAFTGMLFRLAGRLKNAVLSRRIAVFAPTLVVAFTGWSVALSGPYDRRGAEVELAEWVHQQYGPSAVIFGSEGVTPVVAYYAKASWCTLWAGMDDAAVLNKIEQLGPDVILILATRRKDSRETKNLVEKIKELKYAEIDRMNLPHAMDDVLVVLNRGDVVLPVNDRTGAKNVSRK